MACLKFIKVPLKILVSALYEEETIEGKRVREIIKNYEEENGLESKLVEHEEDEKRQKRGIKMNGYIAKAGYKYIFVFLYFISFIFAIWSVAASFYIFVFCFFYIFLETLKESHLQTIS